MGTYFEDLLMRMKNAPHVGLPKVTNPKVPTKVERDAATFAARQREMPKFEFGKGTFLEKLAERMANAQHTSPTYADPNFHIIPKTLSKAEFAEFQDRYEAYSRKLRDEVAKQKKEKNASSTQIENEKEV